MIRFFGGRGRFGFLPVLFLAYGCNDPAFVPGPQDIDVSPDRVEFGMQPAETGRSIPVAVANVGRLPLELGALRIEPEGALFAIGNVSPSITLPHVLAPGRALELEIRYLPPEPGPDLVELVIDSDDPDEPTVRVPLTGNGFLERSERLEQGRAREADLLFVVDDSGSMKPDQAKLARSFATFIDWLVDRFVSFRIGVTTTDMTPAGAHGRLVGAPRIIDNNTPNLERAFEISVAVGSDGDGAAESGLASALAAVTEPIASSYNAGFLRERARLFVVIVSDENDFSPEPNQHYVDGIIASKGGDPDDVFFAAIVCPPVPDGCRSEPGTGERYHELVESTGGLLGSIDDPDFGETLRQLALEVTAPRADFPLDYVPDPATLAVSVDGLEQPADRWNYDPAENAVVFAPAFIPGDGARVDITYTAIDTLL